MLEEDDDDLVDPEPSDDSEDEEAVVDAVELVFNGQTGELLHEIHTSSAPSPAPALPGQDSQFGELVEDYQEEQEGPSRRKRRRIPVPMSRRRIKGIVLKLTDRKQKVQFENFVQPVCES